MANLECKWNGTEHKMCAGAFCDTNVTFDHTMDQNEVTSEQKDKIKIHFNCEKILIFQLETKVGNARNKKDETLGVKLCPKITLQV